MTAKTAKLAKPSSRAFDGVKVFSCTMYAQRMEFDGRVNAWIEAHPDIRIVDMTIVQSSDVAFHCISVVIFWRNR